MVVADANPWLSTAAADPSRDMGQSPFGGAAGAAGPGPLGQDMGKLFKGEKDNLELADGLYVWACDGVEDRILAKYGKLPASTAAATKPASRRR